MPIGAILKGAGKLVGAGVKGIKKLNQKRKDKGKGPLFGIGKKKWAKNKELEELRESVKPNAVTDELADPKGGGGGGAGMMAGLPPWAPIAGIGLFFMMMMMMMMGSRR